MINKKEFTSTFEYKLIYVFRINDNEHSNCLKIGDATLHSNKNLDDLQPNCHDLNYAARVRIDSYTSTAGIVYDLLHTEIAVYKKDGEIKAFRDYKVHDVLKRSGIRVKYFDTNKKQNEWFVTDLQAVKNAIKAVKEGKSALNSNCVSQGNSPIIFRPEQREAIKKTIARFKVNNRMLWNAKMRFGKTLAALQVAKEMGFSRIIIITHRPVVSDGWFEDFDKIFYDRPDYFFGSKTQGKTISDLIKNENKFVYFASMQDLRGSDLVGGNFDKNNEIFNIDWDFVVIDEAHEGTKTELGKNVLKTVIKEESKYNTYVLELSGTPFNLLTDFEQESIYTWDYIMEQEAKTTWDQYHFGDSNPYEELPKMNIYTYHLEKSLPVYLDVEDKAFNFREFFRIWTGDINRDHKRKPNDASIGDFIHEVDVKSFLDLLCKSDDKNNYPFSTSEYRDYFRHSLWIVPGVKEARALSNLLKGHHVFEHFNIVNVAGDGDEEIDTTDALQSVKTAMTDNPDQTYTITISCGRLTTGVSVPQWTAVLMLAGTYSTVASQYLQTIFRVQTPANINGKIKEECYVFDFAPDRTLKMVAESVQLSARAGSKNTVAEMALAQFLNYCPVISIDGSNMKEYKVSELLQELKKAYAERVARNGFDDPKIYNDELLKLSEVELKEFENLKKIVGNAKQTKKTGIIDINKEGFSDEETQEEKDLSKKKKTELTEEEKERLAELKEKRKNRDSAISILRAISIRMPLLVYGMDKDISVDVTIDNFTDNIDDLSWEEFMPRGVSKDMFKQFSKYYDKDIFVAASRRIRYISKTADELEPTERVKKIASLFSTFKNPDKETVLTPWRVVNMHLSDTIGGFNFFDAKHENILDEPRLVEIDGVTDEVFNKDSSILEINSKTGLYPLYMTYSLYKKQCDDCGITEFGDKQKLWDEVVKNQIFVVCKTPMAKLITKRTLVGYRNVKINTKYFEDLINQLRQESKLHNFINKMRQGKSYWKVKESDNMKFNAIVGNPPYQLMDGGASASATPVYNMFVEAAMKIKPYYLSMIMPSRWMTGGKGLDDFRKRMIHDKRMAILHDYAESSKCFKDVDIKGGVCYFLWNSQKEDECHIYRHTQNDIKESKRFLADGDTDIFIREEKLVAINNKVSSFNEEKLESIVSARKPYGLEAETMIKAEKFGLPHFSSKPIEGGYKIFGLDENKKRAWKYLPSDYPIPKMNDGLNKYKVFIAEAYGCGAIGEVPSTPVLSTPVLSTPGELCTETFLQIGPFDSEIEAENCIKYIKTKFFRTLVSIQKQTQHTTQKAYRFVPLQKFASNDDIDWSQNTSCIDKQLYKKYGLSDDEIDFIEKNIKQM